MQDFKEQKKEGHVTPQNENKNFPVTAPQKIKICGFPDRECKIVVLREFSEL